MLLRPPRFQISNRARGLAAKAKATGSKQLAASGLRSRDVYARRLARGGAAAAVANAFSAETLALAAAMSNAGSPMTRRRKLSYDWGIKALKDCGAWTKIIGLYKVGHSEAASLINIKSPGTKDLTKVGTPTFVANTSWTGSTGNYLMTGIFADDFALTDIALGVSTTATATSALNEMGAMDATNGLVLCAKNNLTSNVPSGKLGSVAFAGIGAAANWTGINWCMVTRSNGTTVTGYNGPLAVGTAAVANTSLPHREIALLGCNINGAVTITTKPATMWMIGGGLTAAQAKVIANVEREWEQAFRLGEFDMYDRATAPETITGYDVVVYGATSGGMVFAYEAKRRGMSVCVVGGWRDYYNPGGMSAGGLGFSDYNQQSALQGLPRWMMLQLQTAQGTGATDFTFEPNMFTNVLRDMFDPRTTHGLDIPIYLSGGTLPGGVESVSKSGANINSFTTSDGRTYSAVSYYYDASYEGDLAFKAGVTMTYGRNAAIGAPGSNDESLSGYQGINVPATAGTSQTLNHAGTRVAVDPWITPGDTGSGLLPHIAGRADVGQPAIGSADTKLQSANFRMTLNTGLSRRAALFDTAPPNYNALDYEILGRNLALDATMVLGDILKLDPVNNTTYDVNHQGGWSTDLWNGMNDNGGYLQQTYVQREITWKAHENYQRGMMYWLGYSGDSRIPATMVTAARTYGLDKYHYCRPHPNDDYNWMTQLYTRQGYRMVSDLIWTANDLTATAGSTPRSIKTVAAGSYGMDAHPVQSLAYDTGGGVWGIVNEGSLYISTVGAFPLPYDIYIPKVADCTNLFVGFANSTTSNAFGAIRMEWTFMLASQTLAMAAAQGKTNGNQTVQAIDYTALRATALSGVGLLPGETVQSLPQTR